MKDLMVVLQIMALQVYVCGYVCMKLDGGGEWELGFDPQPPSRDKVSSNEALSCCAEETVGPPGEEDDLEDHKHTTSTNLKQSNYPLM